MQCVIKFAINDFELEDEVYRELLTSNRSAVLVLRKRVLTGAIQKIISANGYKILRNHGAHRLYSKPF